MASAITLLFSSPIFIVKTRICLQQPSDLLRTNLAASNINNTNNTSNVNRVRRFLYGTSSYTTSTAINNLVKNATANGTTTNLSKAAANVIDDRYYYRNAFDGFRKIIKYEGPKGFFKGMVPNIWGISHGVIQFFVYERLNYWFSNSEKPFLPKDATMQYIFCAAISKIVAGFPTYPYQVIRTRIQDTQTKYTGSWDVVKRIYR